MTNAQEREREELKAKQAERELAKMAEERRRQTLRMVEAEVNSSKLNLICWKSIHYTIC